MQCIRVLTLTTAISLLVSTKALAALYFITFSLDTEELYSGIQLSIDYSGASGEFGGEGEEVLCDVNSGLGALGLENDVDASDELRMLVLGVTEFEGAVDLYECTFSKTGAAPQASDFTITVDDWLADTHSTAPTVSISDISAK